MIGRIQLHYDYTVAGSKQLYQFSDYSEVDYFRQK